MSFEQYRGDYGGGEEIVDSYFTLEPYWYNGPWEYSITLPYARLNGFDEDEWESEQRHRRTISGLGDVTANARFRTTPETNDRSMMLSARVKFGTGDPESGIGTGENDYGVGFEYNHSLEAATVTLGAGYTRYGDTAEEPLDDALSVSFGLGGEIGNGYTGAWLFAEQPVFPGEEGAREISLYYGREVAGRDVGLYLLRGLSESSPDWGYGISITFY